MQRRSVTVSFDHDVIDGAPAARFTQRLKELMERRHVQSGISHQLLAEIPAGAGACKRSAYLEF